MEPAPGVPSNMQERYDKFAILLSGICALHCIAVPIIASIVPLLTATVHHGGEIHEFWFHQFILLFILPVSLLALATGFKTHHKITPIMVAGLGLAILTSTALFAEYLLSRHALTHEGETVLTIAGGIVHAVGHILNLQAARRKQPHCSSA